MSAEEKSEEDLENFGITNRINIEQKCSSDSSSQSVVSVGHPDKKKQHYSIYTSITNMKMKASSFPRILGLISSLVLLLTIIASVILFIVYGKSRNWTILSFEFATAAAPFETNVVCLFLCLILIVAGLSIHIASLLVPKDADFLNIFYEDTANFYIVINFLLLGPFILGMIYSQGLYSIIIVLVSSTAALGCNLFLYQRIKLRKNFSITALMGHNVYISILLSFLAYIVIYNAFLAFLKGKDVHTEAYQDLREKLSVAANSIYACCAVVCIAITKDIVFSMLLLIIEIGHISNAAELAYSELIAAFTILVFILISVFITIIRYRRLACGYDDSDELVQSLTRAREQGH